jgi:hypothetical protein
VTLEQASLPHRVDPELYFAAMAVFHRYGNMPVNRVGPWVLDVIDQCGFDARNPAFGPEQARAKAVKELEHGPPRKPRVSFDEDYNLVRRYSWLMRELPPIWGTGRNSVARDAVREVLGRYRGTPWSEELPHGQTPSTFALNCLGVTEETLRRTRRRLETRWRDDVLASALDFSHLVELQPNGMLRRRQDSRSSLNLPFIPRITPHSTVGFLRRILGDAGVVLRATEEDAEWKWGW